MSTIDPAIVALLETVFAPLGDNPFFVKDGDLRYVAANRAMLDLCGARYPADLIGRTAHDVYAGADAARYELDERGVLSGAAIVDRVEQVRAARKAPVWLIFSQYPLRLASGTVAGVIGVGRDMRRHFPSQQRFDGFARALHLIRERFDQPLDGRALASCAGLSVSQLEREFRRVLGVTPSRYQQRVRLDEALRHMSGDLSIAAIAQLSGFSDHSSFTRCFKALTGVTPTAWRAQQ